MGRKPVGKSSHTTDNANIPVISHFGLRMSERVSKREGVGPNRSAKAGSGRQGTHLSCMQRRPA